MKSIKYLLIALACCFLLHCKKATNDVLPPVVTTGSYSPANQVITGGISNLSEYVVKYGHIWDTLPNPLLETALGSSMNDYTGALTDSITIITSVNFLPDTKYYIVGYAIDEFEQVIPGQEILEYDPSDPTLNPVACFIASQSVCEAGNCSVNFDARCSKPENFITRYKWDVDDDGFTDFSGADKQNINHNYDEAGTYTVKLEVLTSSGIIDDTTYIIQVNESTNNLIACFNMSKTECDIDDCTVSFDASCSQNETKYKWDFDGDGVSDDDAEITTYPYTTPGTYEVRLIVEDIDDNADTTFQTIQVYDIVTDFDIPNDPFYENCTSIQFTNNSTGATSYLWNFGDGIMSTLENPAHIYENPGNYTVTLTAINGGIEETNTQSVNVTPTIKFENIRDDGSADIYEDVIVLSDDAYVIAGYTSSQGAGGYDVYLIKTDADGNMEWEKTFGGSDSDWASSIVSAPDGGYVIAGHTYSQGAGSGSHVYLIKTDANGNMLWEKTFGGSDYLVAESIVSAPDGGYVIASTQTHLADLDDVYLIKTDANGNIQWEKTFGGIDRDKASSIVSAPDGGYVIAGGTWGAGSFGVYLIKTDANGNMQWEKTFGESDWDFASSIVSAPDGAYVIAGYTRSQGAGSADVYLIKIDANGNMLWEKTFGGSGYDNANSIVSTPDGGYAIAGQTESQGAGASDVYLIKTDANGNMQWEKTFGGSGGDYGHSIKTTNDCGYMIAGQYYNGSNGDFYLIKTDGAGNAQ